MLAEGAHVQQEDLLRDSQLDQCHLLRGGAAEGRLPLHVYANNGTVLAQGWMPVSNRAFLNFRTCVIPEYLQHGLLALRERFRRVHKMNAVLSERCLVELLRLRQSWRGLGLFRLVQMDLSEQRGETFGTGELQLTTSRRHQSAKTGL